MSGAGEGTSFGPAAGFPFWLGQRAKTHRQRSALIAAGRTMTYGELERRAAQIAAKLRAAGVRGGDRVAVPVANRIACVEAMHAISRLGAVLVPLNPRLAREEGAGLLADCGARFLLCDPLRDEAAAEWARKSGTTLLAVAGARGNPAPREVSGDAAGGDLSAVHSIVYTSGSAGPAKGVLLTHGNHFWSAVGSAFRLGVHPDDRWLAVLPFCHVGGLAVLLRSVLYGTTVVLQDGFDPERVNRAIDAERVTLVSVVATMLRRMLDARRYRPYPESLRCVLTGGGPLPRPLLDACLDSGVPVAPTYGLTEAASQIATLHPRDTATHRGSSGKPLLTAEIAVLEGADAVAAGEVGTIAVRGPTLSPGFVGEAVPAGRPDGWFRTGDAGMLDEDGFLYVLGREDDVILSGGENIHPAEVESALQSHPAVREVCVYGLPDPEWGQTVAAGVCLRAGAAVTATDLIEHARRSLAGFKVPRAIRFCPELPHTPAGKIDRRAARGDHARERSGDREDKRGTPA